MSPRYVSKEGTWHSAKEKIGLKNLSGETKVVDGKEVKHGEPYIYEGADRASLFEFYKAGVETFGQDFRKNPEFLQAIRTQGFGSVDEYLKYIGYDKEKVEKEFEEKASVVHKDELPKKVKAIETLGGGVDTSGGGQDRYGGFGPQPKD